MITELLDLIYISLACAFLANLLTVQNGPMMIFAALRLKIGTWASTKSANLGQSLTNSKAQWRRKQLQRKIKFYKSVASFISCPYCLGPWIVFVFVAIFANELSYSDVTKIVEDIAADMRREAMNEIQSN